MFDSELCFVYDDKQIKGCVFNIVIDNKLRLNQILVREKDRNKGIGRALVKRSEAEAFRRGISMLETMSRDKTVGFYLRLGWVPTEYQEYYIIRE